MVVGAISISVNLWSVQMLSDTEFLHIRIGKLKITVRPGNTSPANVFYYLPVQIRLLKFYWCGLDYWHYCCLINFKRVGSVSGEWIRNISAV